MSCKCDFCRSLTSVTIPNSVTKMGTFVFDNCSNLTTVIIGNGVKKIDERAFGGWTNLKSVTIGSSVSSIANYSFFGCDKLQKVISKIKKTYAIPLHTFTNIAFSNATLYVPKGTVNAYMTTKGWEKFFKIEEEGTTTGIDDVEADNTLNTSNAIYDINGKRLSATSLDELPSGLYIINGKKVVK